MAYFQKAIESKPSVNITRGPIGLNCGSLSTVDPKDYGGRYNYSLSINSDSDDITYINNYFEPVYNETKTIRIRQAERAFRQFKFNYYSFKFDNTYPVLSEYILCKENPVILHSYHSVFYGRQLDTQNYRILQANDFQLCYVEITSTTTVPTNTVATPTTDVTQTPTITVTTQTTTTDVTETPTTDVTATPTTDVTTTLTTTTTITPPICTVTCAPMQVLDTASCNCVDPPICDPQTTCIPIPLPVNIDTTIYGYVFYVDSLRNVNIPNIGDVRVTCGGGHRCPYTLFKPQLIKSDSSIIDANRNVCLDNTSSGNDGSQIPAIGFTDLTGGERSDTFTFTIDDSSDIQGASVVLDCQYQYCHDGVTFLVLVGFDNDTSEYKLLFSSCLLPSEIKDIGTIDCPTNDPPQYCDGDYMYACFKAGFDSCGEQLYVCRAITPSDSPGDYVGFYLNDPSCGGGCPGSDCSPTVETTTTITTPTLPPDVGEDCCFCSVESGTFQIYSNPLSQAWELQILPCGLTEISGPGSTTVNCNGTLYEIEWTPSGNFDSSNYEIYDATITPV